MNESQLRRWRHDIRGHMNALKLSLTVLALVNDPREVVEMLDQIIRESEAIESAMAALDDMDEPQASV